MQQSAGFWWNSILANRRVESIQAHKFVLAMGSSVMRTLKLKVSEQCFCIYLLINTPVLIIFSLSFKAETWNKKKSKRATGGLRRSFFSYAVVNKQGLPVIPHLERTAIIAQLTELTVNSLCLASERWNTWRIISFCQSSSPAHLLLCCACDTRQPPKFCGRGLRRHTADRYSGERIHYSDPFRGLLKLPPCTFYPSARPAYILWPPLRCHIYNPPMRATAPALPLWRDEKKCHNLPPYIHTHTNAHTRRHITCTNTPSLTHTRCAKPCAYLSILCSRPHCSYSMRFQINRIYVAKPYKSFSWKFKEVQTERKREWQKTCDIVVGGGICIAGMFFPFALTFFAVQMESGVSYSENPPQKQISVNSELDV